MTRPPEAKPTAVRTAKRFLSAVLPVVIAASGALDLACLLGGPVPAEKPKWLWKLLPFDFVGLSRPLTLLLGFSLVLAAIHLWSRKRRALHLAVALACASVMVHLPRSSDVTEVLSAAIIAALLLWIRDLYSVESDRPTLWSAAQRGLAALSIPFLYGMAGFWLLKPREFGENFHWWDASVRTVQVMTFVSDHGLLPRTPYAAWFLDSITLITFASLAYIGLILFRPVAYRFRNDPLGQERAAVIAARYGRSAQDFFKHYSDKSFFFSGSGESFVAYRVARGFAIALGDPVGPEHELSAVIDDFAAFCRMRGWGVGFHQVFPDRLPTYLALGFRRLKVGEDALVNLASFSLAGSAAKELRNSVNRLKRMGYRVERLEPPVDGREMEQLRSVSDAWLRLPGHRERRFTLGWFDPAYVRSTAVYAALDGQGRVTAFLNLVPSYRRGLATVDLMRRRPDAPNGIMDFLFAEAFMDLRARGHEQFSLGMAPLAEFRAGERRTVEERLLHWLLKKAPFLFRADTLRRFKSKYASQWEARYSVYRNPLDLPKLALAFRRISELERMKASA